MNIKRGAVIIRRAIRKWDEVAFLCDENRELKVVISPHKFRSPSPAARNSAFFRVRRGATT